MKKEEDLRILLLQIREDRVTMMEEFYEFIQCSGLKEENFVALNAFTTPALGATLMHDYDALFVGGSSDASVLAPEEYQFLEGCKNLLRHCYDQDIPVFASCFGFQIAVEEFGGKIILDRDNFEMGSLPIQLTDAANDDLLLHDTPNPLWAISGHKERALHLPKEAILLAHTEMCPYHAFKFPNKPFYAFQFHPEVNCQDLIARITRYQAVYLESGEALHAIINATQHETPDSNALVRKFVERVLLA